MWTHRWRQEEEEEEVQQRLFFLLDLDGAVYLVDEPVAREEANGAGQGEELDRDDERVAQVEGDGDHVGQLELGQKVEHRKGKQVQSWSTWR